jgi:hypothetical protein
MVGSWRQARHRSPVDNEDAMSTTAKALERLTELVAAGAEIEQRDADGRPIGIAPDGSADNVLPLARDTAVLDEHDELWLRPLYGAANYDEHDDERPLYDGPAHRPAPIPVTRLDLLDDGNVGIAHASGDYSVVRPVGPSRAATVDEWDRCRVLG